MSKEICVSSTPHETRLAILEDDQLTEVYYERENEYTLAGSIYKGRVTRVLPGMQSAFVDLGLERDAFLYVTDFMEEQEDSSDFERIPGNGEEAARAPQARENREAQSRQPRPVEDEAPRRNGAPAAGPRALPVRRRRESLRMEPGVGAAAAAAARAFGHRKAASRQPRNTAARGEVPRPHRASRRTGWQPTDGRQSRSLFRVSRFPNMAFRALPQRLPCRSTAVPRSRGPMSILAKPSTLIETPIEWNGDGLLPGESISRYRGSAKETAAPSDGRCDFRRVWRRAACDCRKRRH